MCVCSEAGGGAAEGGVEADGTVSIFFSSKKRKGISEERGKKKADVITGPEQQTEGSG